MNNSKKLSESLARTTPFPIGLEITSAKGSYLTDIHGKNYLDLTSGIAVSSLGHGHPSIITAIKEQVDRHLHVMVYGEFIQDQQTAFAEKLVSILPDSLNQVYFVNSGTEANEGALKLAKRYTGRKEIVSFHKSYHGSTHGSLSVSGNQSKKDPFEPLLPGIKFIDFNKVDQLTQINNETACVIMETIQGDAGVRIPSLEFMKALRVRCTQVGALLILDEIQTGVGRTGKLFAFEHYGIIPDILTAGKALGAGMPIGAFISSNKIMESLSDNPMLGHITTFGGHPVVCASGLAGLNVLERENIIAGVEAKGELFESLLQHVNIKEIRRSGLLFAIELSNTDEVQHVVNYCQDKGVLSFWFLSCPESFRIAPPLNITTEDIRFGCQIIKEALDSI
jgi:acetylornithine/N-succinyldiaminopimelate aminotransferase